MTIEGTVNKSMLLIGLVVAGGYFTWQNAMAMFSGQMAPRIPAWYWPVALGGFVLGLAIVLKKTWAPVLAPVYAVLQGALLGALSALFEMRFPGIVTQAVLCTGGTFVALLMAYKSKLIPVTENFKLGVVAATGGIALVYLVSFGLSFFGINMPYIHDAGPVGIGVSVVITIVAALNLVLDFDFIEKGADKRAPKYMEWYAAFGLLVTLIWLYIEFLRLLSKLRKK